MSTTDVLVHVEIQRSDSSHHQKGFGEILYTLRRCPHDIDLFFTVKMTSSQWKHVAAHDDMFILFQAELKGSVLDVTRNGAGVIAKPGNRLVVHEEGVMVSGELFAGGFSGWAHALRRLCDLGWKLDHKFAVEIDAECIDAYMKSHAFKHRCGPKDFHWEHDDLPSHLVIHADVRDGAWFHLTGCVMMDFLMMSSPCPAWSLATSAAGIMKEEGRLTIEAIALCNLLKPKVILFENCFIYAQP